MIYRNHGESCQILRNGKLIYEQKGIVSDGEIQFSLESPIVIQKGDTIIVEGNDKYRVDKAVSNKGGIAITPFLIAHVTHFDDINTEQVVPQQTFNINLNNSNNNVIGDNNSFTNSSFNATIDYINKHADELSPVEKVELQEMLDELQKSVHNNQIDKSFFSKFGDFLKRNSWAIEPVGKLIIFGFLQL